MFGRLQNYEIDNQIQTPWKKTIGKTKKNDGGINWKYNNFLSLMRRDKEGGKRT
jgi:hypothetical protein